MNPGQLYGGWESGIINGDSLEGEKVTETTALSISSVYACVDLLSRTIASLSLGYYQRNPDGTIQEVLNSPEGFTFCVEPSDLYTSYTWRRTMGYHLFMKGNAYSVLKTDRSGRVNNAEILHPDYTFPFLKDGKLYYEHFSGTERKIYMAGEILHIKSFSDNGLVGMSPLSAASRTVSMGLAANKYAANMYNNGGGLRGIITYPNQPSSLRSTQIDALRDNFSTLIKQGKVPVLQSGAEFKVISINPKDAEFIASHKLTIQDIARFYGVPLHLIGDLERSTNNNIEHQGIEFVTHTVRPIVKNFESELSRRAIRKSERQQNFFRFNLDSLLRGDSAARSAYITQMLSHGVYNIDEARALDNLNPLPNNEGKRHYIGVNMATIETVNEGNIETPQP